ncbi:hypothetical protein BGZ72_007285 [Mortierella alpina]|nr:hypothetical protein BGZ72_007285 [Mortierella alpina]
MGLAWRESDLGSYLATGNDENTVRMWRVTEEDGKPCLSLQWSSPHTSLKVKDASIQNVHGLTRMQIQLLKQRGNVGEPIPPLNLRTAGEKLIDMAAIVNRLSKAPKKELSDDIAEDTFGGETGPSGCRRSAEFVSQFPFKQSSGRFPLNFERTSQRAVLAKRIF